MLERWLPRRSPFGFWSCVYRLTVGPQAPSRLADYLRSGFARVVFGPCPVLEFRQPIFLLFVGSSHLDSCVAFLSSSLRRVVGDRKFSAFLPLLAVGSQQLGFAFAVHESPRLSVRKLIGRVCQFSTRNFTSTVTNLHGHGDDYWPTKRPYTLHDIRGFLFNFSTLYLP